MEPALQAQITSAVRIAISIGLTWIVARGLISADQVGPLTQQIVDTGLQVIALFMMVWGIAANRKKALISKVADMSDVKRVVTSTHIADMTLVDHPKVTSR